MDAVKRAYGGVSAEQRQADRRARLLSAGLDLLAEVGTAKLTVTAICARAGLTERYFYENFSDRDDLMLAIFDREATRAADVIMAAVEAAPPHPSARARVAVTVMFEELVGDPRLSEITIQGQKDDVLSRVRAAVTRVVSDALTPHAGLFWDGAENHPAEAHLAFLVIIAGIAEIMGAWLGGAVPYTRDQLVDRCVELFIAVGKTMVGSV